MFRLCSLAELQHFKARGFDVDHAGRSLAIIVVHDDAEVYAYINSCPHTGIHLDWVKDRFLNSDETHLQCATHGAKFQLHDGYCVFGPCRSESLQAVKLTQDEHSLYAVL